MFDPSRVRVGLRGAASGEDAIRAAAALLAGDGPDKDAEAERIAEALLGRERLASTAIGNGLAFPHAKLPGLDEPLAAVVILAPPGVDMGAADGRPVRILAALVVPAEAEGSGLKALGALSSRFRDAATCAAMLEAADAARVAGILAGGGK